LPPTRWSPLQRCGRSGRLPLAFANIYRDLADKIAARQTGKAPDPAAGLYARAEDGLRLMAPAPARAFFSGAGCPIVRRSPA